MHQYYRDKRLYLILLILSSLIEHSISTNPNAKSNEANDIHETNPTSSEPPIQESSDTITKPVEHDNNNPSVENNIPIDQINPSEPIDEVNPTEPEPVGQDELGKPKKDIIIRYHIEKEQQTPEININIDMNNILQNIDANLQKENPDPSSTADDQSTEIDNNIDEEEDDEIPLTPEMIHANTIYHQAMKLINGSANRQYETAYKLFTQAASLGHIGAKEELAFGHLLGIHLPMDFNRAKAYFEEGIAVGSSRSHYGLYYMNSVGFVPDASISKALVHLTFAASDGHQLAQMALAYRYWRSINVGHNCELALMFYQEVATHVASKITTASGQLVLRLRLYDEEEHPIQNNILLDTSLFQYYQLLADRGDPQAQYGIGQLYYFRDTAFDKALYYFRLAAENGNINAIAYLGKLYSEKNDFVKQDNQTAFSYFQRASEKGNSIGQAGLGLAYYHGAGVEQSFEKALKLFQLSADQSYVDGQLMLGVMYYNGEGVKRDFKMAIKWFQAASQSGNILAYYNLAQMHATGTGVLRSCPTATDLFKNVAERGRWSNMFVEAFSLYKDGHVEQAFMMYLYLAELGYEVAQSNVAYIIDKMSYDISNIYKTKEEKYKKALLYWNRAAIQGFHHARVKLGDHYYYGHGTEQNYELAAGHYKFASDQSQNPHAMFNLAYMYEKGLGFKRDLHLAKRFYDMAVETNADASLPVAIVLLKLQFETFFSSLFSMSSDKSSNTEDNKVPTIDLDSSWDLYLMAVLLGLLGALYTIRRQRAALRQQAVRNPVH